MQVLLTYYTLKKDSWYIILEVTFALAFMC